MATADIFDWLAATKALDGTAMIANLVLHHFREKELHFLFAQIAMKADVFAACEPKRAKLPLLASRLLGCIGCGRVTRHDAVASVRSGFIGSELSDLWPPECGWQKEEGEAGLFSHYFVARRHHHGR